MLVKKYNWASHFLISRIYSLFLYVLSFSIFHYLTFWRLPLLHVLDLGGLKVDKSVIIIWTYGLILWLGNLFLEILHFLLTMLGFQPFHVFWEYEQDRLVHFHIDGSWKFPPIIFNWLKHFSHSSYLNFCNLHRLRLRVSSGCLSLGDFNWLQSRLVS